METVAEKLYTVAEYFEMEQHSEERHEFVNGNLIQMPGESTAANKIAGNIYISLRILAKSQPFEVYMQAVKLRVDELRNYRYPDVMVVQEDGVSKNFADNPVVVVEVLSAGTEETDRSTKLLEYTAKPTLQQYLLVAQDKMLVEVYARNGDKWEWTHHQNPTDAVELPLLGGRLPLREVYEGLGLSGKNA